MHTLPPSPAQQPLLVRLQVTPACMHPDPPGAARRKPGLRMLAACQAHISVSSRRGQSPLPPSAAAAAVPRHLHTYRVALSQEEGVENLREEGG